MPKHSPQETRIWSKRFSVAHGWHWKMERNVIAENARAWLRIFSDDEPKVEFCISATKPQSKR